MGKDVFVHTSNAKRLLAGLSALKDRGAEEACILVLDGEPGVGKTQTVQWWSTRNDCIYLRAKKEWKPGWFLRELLQELRVTPMHSFEKMFSQALTALIGRQSSSRADGSQFALVVDEVDHIVRRADILETIRDLSDMLEVPVVLVGMGRVRATLARYPQIASRVGQYVEFKRATLEDVQAMTKTLCKREVDPALIEFLWERSKGLAREIKEGLASIERFGARNPGVVTLAAMVGQTLMNDRTSGKPITVQA